MRGLEGVRVLVTRPRGQAEAMVAALRAAGADASVFSPTRIADAADGGAGLRAAAAGIGGFDWVVLGSANGAARLVAALDEAGTREAARTVRFACVGPATAVALREAGLEPAVVAGRAVAEGLLESLAGVPLEGARVLLPQAAGARPVLREGLAVRGAGVTAVEAYRSVPDGNGAGEVRERLDRGEIDAVTFTAPSAVEQFAGVIGPEVMRGVVVAVIGPVTAEAARAAGMPPRVVAEQHTVPGLIDALVEHYTNPSRTKQP